MPLPKALGLPVNNNPHKRLFSIFVAVATIFALVMLFSGGTYDLAGDVSYMGLYLFLIISGAIGAAVISGTIYSSVVVGASWIVFFSFYSIFQETPMWRFSHHLVGLLLLVMATVLIVFLGKIYRAKYLGRSNRAT